MFLLMLFSAITLNRGGTETNTNPSFKNPRETSVLRQKIYEDKVDEETLRGQESKSKSKALLRGEGAGWGRRECRSHRKAASLGKVRAPEMDVPATGKVMDEEGTHVCFHPDSSGANAPSLTGNQSVSSWINQTRQA